MKPDDHEDEDSPSTWRAIDMAAGEISRDRAPYENEGPRDAPMLRWLKFLAILIVLPTGFGVGVAIEEYFRLSYSKAKELMQSDGWLFVRFKIGAGIGIAIGLAYVVRCIVREEDP